MEYKATICHVTTVHPIFDVRIFYKECLTIAKAGYEVVLIAQHNKNEIIEGVRIASLPKVKSRIYRMCGLTLRAFWLALKQKADIYHFHDPELIPVSMMLKLFGKKVIYDVHEDYPEQILSKGYISEFWKKILSRSFRTFENITSKYFDFIITTTNAIKNKFLRFTPTVKDVRNYISVMSAKEINQKKIKRDDDELKMIFLGGIDMERGIMEGVEAVNSLSELHVKFILYGSMSNKNVLNEFNKIDKLSRLEYEGIIPYTEVFDKLAGADIGYICDCPLERNIVALPIKLFEYMAAGIPVIASDFPLWREIVEGSNCGICVDPTNPEEIANAIKQLYEKEETRNQMGENGQQAILAKYNWEAEGEKLLKVYSNLLKGNNNV